MNTKYGLPEYEPESPTEEEQEEDQIMKYKKDLKENN